MNGNTTARFIISVGNNQGTLNARIPAGAMTDTSANPNSEFATSYQVDIDTAEYPTPLTAKEPFGSLIYDPAIAGLINLGGDIDDFTLNLDAGVQHVYHRGESQHQPAEQQRLETSGPD